MMLFKMEIQAVLSCIFLLLFFSSGHADETLQRNISLPPGFSIEIYAQNVPDARSLALGPDNIVFVGSRKAGKVYAVLDRDGDFVADEVVTIAKGLNMPNGVAFYKGDLYVAEIQRIIKFKDIKSHLYNPGKPVVVFNGLPDKRWHGWKFIRFGPDGKLYIPIGAPCNVCEPGDPFGTITRINLHSFIIKETGRVYVLQWLIFDETHYFRREFHLCEFLLRQSNLSAM